MDSSLDSPTGDWDQVDSWLRHLYPHHTPPFERTPETLQALLRLKYQNEAADSIVHVLVDAQREINSSKRAQNHQLLDDHQLHIKPSFRSHSALTTLSFLATTLGLEHTSLSSFQTAFSALTLESMDAEIESQTLEESEYPLAERINKLAQKKKHLQSTLELMRQAKQDTEDDLKETWKSTNAEKKKEIKHKLDLLTQKQKEYDATKVEQHGLRLSDMQNLVNDTRIIQEKLANKQEYLERYKDLPPDMVMASFKTQEAEDRLYELRQERESLLADIAASVQ
ncbi:hypothetical protein CLU79DRAFT_737792 [Phycomyces nitens]|nr:hypothetical protein CLU79DRAFT_737792 [Phycomyces nitens]